MYCLVNSDLVSTSQTLAAGALIWTDALAISSFIGFVPYMVMSALWLE
jgi:hypothetical protein